MTEEVKRMQEHLTALDTFIKGPAHEGFVSAKRAEISQVKERILMLPPINQDNISQSLMAFGEWETLEEEINTFEVARVTLKKRIDETVERETQNATETKV